VDPPSAMTSAIAFSNAFLTRILRGVIRFLTSSMSARPARRVSSRFSALSASRDELNGRLMPSASMAEAIVLAVYMPPQEPAPGQAWHSIARNCSRVILPVPNAPTASKMLTMSTSLPSTRPGLMVPP